MSYLRLDKRRNMVPPPCCGKCSATPEEKCKGCGRTYGEVNGWRFIPIKRQKSVVMRCYLSGYITDAAVLSRYPWLTQEPEPQSKAANDNN